MEIFIPNATTKSGVHIKDDLRTQGFTVSDRLTPNTDAIIPLTDNDIVRTITTYTDRSIPSVSLEKFNQLTDKSNTEMFTKHQINVPDTIVPMSIKDVEDFPHDSVIMKMCQSFAKRPYSFTHKTLSKETFLSRLPSNFFEYQSTCKRGDRYVLQQSLRTEEVLPVIILSVGTNSKGDLFTTRYSQAFYTNGEVNNHGFAWFASFPQNVLDFFDKLQNFVREEQVLRSMFSVQLIENNGELLLIDWNHRHTIPGIQLNLLTEPQSYSAFLRNVYQDSNEQYQFTQDWVCSRLDCPTNFRNDFNLLAKYPNVKIIPGDVPNKSAYYTEYQYKEQLYEYQNAFLRG